MSSNNLIRNLRKQWPVGPGNRVVCEIMDEAADKIEELEAKLAEHEKQEPVAWASFNDDGNMVHLTRKPIEGLLYIPLYTSPAPMEEKK